MVAHQCGLGVGEFIFSGGDCHLYQNHFEQAKLQLQRDPKPLPTRKIQPGVPSIFDYKYEHIELENYVSHPVIKGKVAV